MANIQAIIPFTYKHEGGLSRATTDKASKNPANISPYTIKGVKGWHTNKGVTYSVFKEGAAKYGYKDTLENFVNMPHEIWLKIAKNGYWDIINLDNVKSQAVANLMFSWMWGSGYAWRNRVKSYLKSKGIYWNISDLKGLYVHLNNLTEKQGEKQTFDELTEQKRQFLLSLNQPKNEKGWMNRLNELKSYSYTLMSKPIEYVATSAKEVVKKNPYKVAALTIAIALTSYIGYKLIIKNK